MPDLICITRVYEIYLCQQYPTAGAGIRSLCSGNPHIRGLLRVHLPYKYLV